MVLRCGPYHGTATRVTVKRVKRLPLALPRLVGFRKVRQILSGRRIVEPQQTTQ